MQFVVIAALAALHIVALENALYWKFQWFDIMTHFLGGIWAGLFFYWLGAVAGRSANILFAIGGALLLGVLWEVFELAAGISGAPNYVSDTIIDVSMDLLGAVLAAMVATGLFTIRKKNEAA